MAEMVDNKRNQVEEFDDAFQAVCKYMEQVCLLSFLFLIIFLVPMHSMHPENRIVNHNELQSRQLVLANFDKYC